ncbi:hypothetical protein SAMN05443633_11239 [Chryseobacterium arachidis]|uniref:Uncharacterized protein n=3 Tax=Chryseobacterium arachidis TaxID=1416778 RepID=A0A1M5I8E7_9FLAO|nr:hypothetical protein SAMN05443633_11239 [Chryseobacterium arachidis]
MIMAQESFKVLSQEEERKYDLKNLKFYKMSTYNESLAYFLEDGKLLVNPNTPSAEHSLIMNLADFDNDKFPVLPENDTPYYRFKGLMNNTDFTESNMIEIFRQLGFNYQNESFYNDAEKFMKTLSVDDKIKFFIPVLYFIGEDLRKLCPDANWSFETIYYFQPFSEVSLYNERNNFSFYDLNTMLEGKLLNENSITFKNIYKKLETKYLKNKKIWDLR